MTTLSKSQRQDIAELLAVCRQFGADAVIIGATAYRLLIEDNDRQTLDIDLALALDMTDLDRFEQALVKQRWEPSGRQEPRWTTPRGNRFDLIPAGRAARQASQLVWPKTGFVMSLAGFDHVFERATIQDVGDGLRVKVVSPAVLALLKIASYSDNPERRAKDLDDLKRLFRWYDQASDRIFSDLIFDAELPDIELANAFLLGLDLRQIVGTTERQLVDAFLVRLTDPSVAAVTLPSLNDADFNREGVRFQFQLLAFAKGFRAG